MHTRDVRREIAEFPSRSRGRPSLKRNDKASCSFAPPITFLLTEFAGGKMIYLKRNALSSAPEFILYKKRISSDCSRVRR